MMLDSKLKDLARPILDEETKISQLAILQAKQRQEKQKQNWSYVTTLITFTVVMLVFIQTWQYEPPSEQQQADVLTVGTLKKASYLYSTNAERNYHFPSLFISDEMTITDPEKLQQIEQLLNGLEKAPFSESLTNDEGATHYMLEQTNGEKLYLKSVYREQGSLLIDVTTNQAIAFSKDTAIALEEIWLHVYMEQNEIPTWKYVALILFIIVTFIIGRKRKSHTNEKSSFLIHAGTFLAFIYCYSQFTEWYGVTNIAVLLLLMTLFLTIGFALEKLLKRTERSWKEHFLSIIGGLVFLFILFV